MERFSELNLSPKESPFEESNPSEESDEKESIADETEQRDAPRGKIKRSSSRDWSLLHGSSYDKHYPLFRGDRSSGMHRHILVYNAKRDAIYMDGEWKDANSDKYKRIVESLRSDEVPDDFEGDGMHAITEIFLGEGEVYPSNEEEVDVDEGPDSECDDMM